MIPLLDDSTWREIDETQIEPSVRRELLNNGLRAGVIGSSVPAAITRALHQEKPKPMDSQSAALDKNDELMSDPPVHGHVVRLRRNQRSEIQASEIYPSLPLLVSRGTELTGHTYEQAQAVYALRVDPSPDRTVRVEVTPELQYGEPKFRFTSGEDRFLRQASLRDQKVFDQLRMSVKLSPGDMLVLMSLPHSGSRLGHYFHTANSPNGPQQKLILIRLAEVPPSDTFATQSKSLASAVTPNLLPPTSHRGDLFPDADNAKLTSIRATVAASTRANSSLPFRVRSALKCVRCQSMRYSNVHSRERRSHDCFRPGWLGAENQARSVR